MGILFLPLELAEGGSTRIGACGFSPTRLLHEVTSLTVDDIGVPASQGKLSHYGHAIGQGRVTNAFLHTNTNNFE